MSRLLSMVALGGLAYLWYENAYGAPADGSSAPLGPGYVDDPDGSSTSGVSAFTTPLDAMDSYSNPNVPAFLQTIRISEVGSSVADATRYETFYGGSTFSNMSDHPVITGEKQPIRLPDSFCAPAGLNPPCYSSAAGAYQITRPTWLNVRTDKNDGYGYLGDFTPGNQDIAALRLLRANGALALLEGGNLAGAIQSASKLWASLAGSTAGQGAHELSTLVSWFQAAGGAIGI